MSKEILLEDLVSRYQELRRQGQAASPEEVCAGHTELLDDLRARVQALDAMEAFLDLNGAATPEPETGRTPPGAEEGGHETDPDGEPLPEVAGYRVEGKLGWGGMGVVYRAWQLTPRRPVALKMILAGHTGPEDRARLLREAQAQADLEHPHVVRVYEVGEHQGRPYFSQELVEGGSLDKRIDGTPQPPRQAAAWLEPLARALHAAHARGIIHRDLKPSNVLLTSDGIPKVTDFGLAKLVAVSAAEVHAAGLTPSGAIIGTPSYMAPEQAAGKTREVGPATDVYGLGAVLYECLTGRPPFKGETLLDTLQQVLTEEAVPPSRLQPKVPRDLETITLKCLEKEPQRRYASSGELAEDLGRFQRGEPVRARPVGPLARGWRWCRRNRAVAALLALVAFVLVAGASVASALAVVAESARQKAEAARDDAREVVELVASEGQLQVLERQPKLTPEQEKLLRALVAYYQRHVQEETAGETERARQARAYSRIAWMQSRLGYRQEAMEAHRQALQLEQQLAADFPPTPEYRLQLAFTHNKLGNLLAELGKDAEAEAAYRQAIELQRRLAGDFPTTPLYRRDLAGSHGNLGNLLKAQGKQTQAAKAYRQALELQQQLAADFPTVPAYRLELAQSHHNLGNVLAELANHSEAETEIRQALKLQRQLAEDFPDVPDYRRELALAHNSLGVLLADLGKRAEAEAEYRRALELRKQLAADFPTVPQYALDLGASYGNLGHCIRESGQPAASLDWYEKAIAALQPVLRKEPQLSWARQVLFNCHFGRAVALDELSRHAESVADWQRAVELDDQKAPEIRLAHAGALARAGQPAQAVAIAEALAKAAEATAGTLYSGACVFALASAGEKKKAAMRDQYAARALALLQEAVQKGYQDFDRLKEDPDLKVLRSRRDFRELLQHVEVKMKGKAPRGPGADGKR